MNQGMMPPGPAAGRCHELSLKVTLKCALENVATLSSEGRLWEPSLDNVRLKSKPIGQTCTSLKRPDTTDSWTTLCFVSLYGGTPATRSALARRQSFFSTCAQYFLWGTIERVNEQGNKGRSGLEVHSPFVDGAALPYSSHPCAAEIHIPKLFVQVARVVHLLSSVVFEPVMTVP